MVIKLKEFRNAYGYSQQDLAEALGVSQSAVSRTEGVGAELTGPQIEKLCAKFGKDKVMKFVGDSDEQNIVEAAKRKGALGELSPLQVIRILQETIELQKKNLEAQQQIISSQSNLIEEYKKLVEDMKKEIHG